MIVMSLCCIFAETGRALFGFYSAESGSDGSSEGSDANSQNVSF